MEYISGLLSTALRSRGKKSINFVFICFGKSPVMLITCCCTMDLFQLTFQVWRSQFLLLVTQMTSSGHSIYGFEETDRLTWPQQDCHFHSLTARSFFMVPIFMSQTRLPCGIHLMSAMPKYPSELLQPFPVKGENEPFLGAVYAVAELLSEICQFWYICNYLTAGAFRPFFLQLRHYRYCCCHHPVTDIGQG